MSRTFETTVYTFAELSDAAKEKAIECIREKLGGDWWDSFDTEDIGKIILHTLAYEIGEPKAADHGCDDYPGIPDIKVTGWDVERGGSLALDGYLDRDNAPKLPWTPGILSVHLNSRRSDYSTLSVECTDLEEHGVAGASPAEIRAMEEAILTIIGAAIKAGRDEMEYKSSEEYAKEWVENNDHYEYNEDGTLY